ncbi:MAG: tRNA (adenosine(37)-N6)-dimethylallyltransferase MiaA [Bacteroidota bacterium]
MAILISIVGPTGVGKTSLSITLAKRYGSPILSCDARQVYTGMDIGTAKITVVEREDIPHHFIDILPVDQPFTVGQFEQKAEDLLADLFKHQPVVIAVGGSTLYFHTLWYGLDEIPEVKPAVREALRREWEVSGLTPLLTELQEADPLTYETIDRNNHVRVLRALEVFRSSDQPISAFRTQSEKESTYQHIKIGLKMDRELLYKRINNRVDQMLEAGLVMEVEQLLQAGYNLEHQAMRTIGYQEIVHYLQGDYPLEEAIRLIKRNSRRYAKRQMTFYRRYKDILWFEADETSSILSKIAQQIEA